MLIDDVVWGAAATKNPKILAFVIAHELAHHALGHMGFFRRRIAEMQKGLSRCDEFSCDAVAAQLLQDAAACKEGLCLLLVGPHLFSQVNTIELEKQSLEVRNDKYTKKAVGCGRN